MHILYICTPAPVTTLFVTCIPCSNYSYSNYYNYYNYYSNYYFYYYYSAPLPIHVPFKITVVFLKDDELTQLMT